MKKNYSVTIREIVKKLKLPKNEILFLHVRLKGLSEGNYPAETMNLLEEIDLQYTPKTIIIPTYTFSYTKTGIFDIVHTESETGRFGEEARLLLDNGCRSHNPVFSVLDTNNFLKSIEINEDSAFGADGFFGVLADLNYVIVNINLNVLRHAHLHYIEQHLNVPYRYKKKFPGTVLNSGRKIKDVEFEYFVRDVDNYPDWKGEKIEPHLRIKGVLRDCSKDIRLLWMFSSDLDQVLTPLLELDPYFLVKN